MKKNKNRANKNNRCVFEGKKCRHAGKLSVCNTCLHFMIIKGKEFMNYDCKFEIKMADSQDSKAPNKIPLIVAKS